MTKPLKSVMFILIWCCIFSTSFVEAFIPIEIINKTSASLSNVDELSVLTLNTWALPVPFHKSNSKKRYDNLIDRLNKSNYQIICLQETFNKNFRNKLAANIDKKFNISGNPYCTRNTIFDMDCFGGLTTLSVYPILDEEFYKYELTDEYSIIEKIGSKGFLVSTIGIGSDTIAVINTHMYSGSSSHAEKIRMNQLKFMHKKIAANPKYNGMPILYAGDFNIGHPDQYSTKTTCVTYDYLTQNMKLKDSMPKLGKEDFSYDHTTNFYAPKDGPVQKLDYIFMNNDCTNYFFKKAIIVFNKENSSSDHSGVEVSIKIPHDPSKLEYYVTK